MLINLLIITIIYMKCGVEGNAVVFILISFNILIICYKKNIKYKKRTFSIKNELRMSTKNSELYLKLVDLKIDLLKGVLIFSTSLLVSGAIFRFDPFKILSEIGFQKMVLLFLVIAVLFNVIFKNYLEQIMVFEKLLKSKIQFKKSLIIFLMRYMIRTIICLSSIFLIGAALKEVIKNVKGIEPLTLIEKINALEYEDKIKVNEFVNNLGAVKNFK